MRNTAKMPLAAKYTNFSFDSEAKLIGRDDFYLKLDRATAAIIVGVRFPVENNAAVPKLLRDIAAQLEQTSCAMRREV